MDIMFPFGNMLFAPVELDPYLRWWYWSTFLWLQRQYVAWEKEFFEEWKDKMQRPGIQETYRRYKELMKTLDS